MRIYQLFEEQETSPLYSASMLYDTGFRHIWALQAGETLDSETIKFNQLFREILEKYGFKLVKSRDEVNLLGTAFAARTDPTVRLRSLVKRMLQARNEILQEIQYEVYIALNKNGSMLVDGSAEGIRTLQRFIHNHGSIEDDLF